MKQNPNSTVAGADKAAPSRSGPVKKENIGAQYRHHPLRARRRPPKGMHLEQGDITALSASQDSGVLTLRQLDTQLVSLKRQVRYVRWKTPQLEPGPVCPAAVTLNVPLCPQVQSIKQNNSMLKHSLTEGVDGARPVEVSPPPSLVAPPSPCRCDQMCSLPPPPPAGPQDELSLDHGRAAPGGAG